MFAMIFKRSVMTQKTSSFLQKMIEFNVRHRNADTENGSHRYDSITHVWRRVRTVPQKCFKIDFWKPPGATVQPAARNDSK